MVTHQPQPATGESACPPAPRWFLTGADVPQRTNLDQGTNPPKSGNFTSHPHYIYVQLYMPALWLKKLLQSRVFPFPHVLPWLKVAFSLPFA